MSSSSQSRRTMEDVWKEIGLSNLDQQHTTKTTTEENKTIGSDKSRKTIFLEFLPNSHDSAENDVGIINLNASSSSCDHQLVLQTQGLSYAPNDPHVYHAISSNPASKKKTTMDDTADFSVDLRRKRMMKNRESAARSRARKQAYTNELEMVVTELMEENERLKRRMKELCIAAASAAKAPTKQSLCRTSTAPF